MTATVDLLTLVQQYGDARESVGGYTPDKGVLQREKAQSAINDAEALLDRITDRVSQRAAEDAVVRAARRWYYEHGFTAGYLPRNILGSDRDLKVAVESLGGAA